MPYEQVSPRPPHPDWVEKIPDQYWRSRFAEMEAGEASEIVRDNPISRFLRAWRDWWDEILGN